MTNEKAGTEMPSWFSSQSSRTTTKQHEAVLYSYIPEATAIKHAFDPWHNEEELLRSCPRHAAQQDAVPRSLKNPRRIICSLTRCSDHGADYTSQ